MISFFLFYLVGIPLSVLLHEVGHAIGIVMFSKEKAYVYLGPVNDDNKENFRLGRMHFHIKWAFFGFCIVKNRSDFTKFNNILFLAGGPIVSLLLFIAAYFLSANFSHEGTQNFLQGVFYTNLSMFIFTSLPLIYPKWLPAFAGHPSDGYQILNILKSRR